MQNKNTSDNLFPFTADQLHDLNKFKDTCSSIQFAWLSGYFWNMANNNNPVQLPLFNKNTDQDKIVTIVSASQTGNAKTLAHELHEFFCNHNINSRIINASDYKFKKINQEKIFILIISTQGEGEPPEESFSLYKFIMSKKAPQLHNLYYSVFGLGDTSYNLFCQAGKDFDNRIQELGGLRLLKRVDADIEYQKNYEIWSKELLLCINKIYSQTSSVVSMSKVSNIIPSISCYNKKNPAKALISANQKITGRNSTKEIYHIEIDIDHLNLKYSPGDALGVWYKNDTNLVKKILSLLSINIETEVTIDGISMNIFNALKNKFELTLNTQSIVKKYSSFCTDQNFKTLISNNHDLQKYVNFTPLVAMLYEYPSKISAKELISILRPLTPRLYSISSSQEEICNEVHITVGLVKKLFSGSVHLGGSSSYLSQFLKIDDEIKIFIESNNNFRLPIDKNIPIIMIGPGTGIAPFRSFMQQRDNDGAKGRNWLFFGNPSFSEDFLYQIEWQNYFKKKLLTRIDLAWSRDQKQKIYVQHNMQKHSKKIWAWIQEGAHIYVCGNASKMAKDVEKVLIDIISENHNLDLEMSNEFLNNLRLNKRYQRDVY